MSLITTPKGHLPFGYVEIPGIGRVEVEQHPEWVRYFESLEERLGAKNYGTDDLAQLIQRVNSAEEAAAEAITIASGRPSKHEYESLEGQLGALESIVSAVRESASNYGNSYVRVNACSTNFNSGTSTKCTFGTVAKDYLAEWASNTFTAKSAGVYFVSCSLAINSQAHSYVLDEQTRVDIYKNSVKIAAGVTSVAQTTTAANPQTVVVAALDLASGDTVEFYVYNNNSGGAVNANGSTEGTHATIARIQ